MAAIVYSTSPSRVSSSVNQNQYGSYGSVNKSMLSQTHHPSQLQQQHHHMHPGSTSGAPPLSIYQVKEHHNNYLMSHSRNYNYKRKSAVEMLAESKPYYVKSETVLDRHQQLNARGGGGNSSTLSCKLSSKLSTINDAVESWSLSIQNSLLTDFLSSCDVTIASSALASSLLLSPNINDGASSAFVVKPTFGIVWVGFVANKVAAVVEHGKGGHGIER